MRPQYLHSYIVLIGCLVLKHSTIVSVESIYNSYMYFHPTSFQQMSIYYGLVLTTVSYIDLYFILDRIMCLNTFMICAT